MERLRLWLGDIYYNYFSESKRDIPYEGTTFKDRLFHSIFGLMMLRWLIGGIFYYIIEQGYTYVEPYGTANLLWAVLGGYLIAPLVEVLFIKTNKLKVKFLKGAWIPLPMTLVWLLGK